MKNMNFNLDFSFQSILLDKIKIMNKRTIIRESSVIFVLFAVFFAIYWIFVYTMPIGINDIESHAEAAIDMSTGKTPIPGNFLLFTLIIIGSFFSTSTTTVFAVLCLLLASATSFRYYLAQKDIYSLRVYAEHENKNYWLSALFAISLIFVFVIPIPSYFTHDFLYLGNFTPNVWHNSTTIFLFPFAILLYYYSSKQFCDYSSKRDITIFILVLLNIFIKPSFFFTVIAIYPIIMLFKHKFSIIFWKSLLPFVGGGIALLIITWAIFNPENPSGSSITICPLCIYRLRSTLLELPFAILFSMLFPILYTISNLKRLKSNIVYWYTVILLAIAIIIYFLFVETGPRFEHANFYWQIIPCTWIFFFFSLKSLLSDIKCEGLRLKNKLLLCIYSLHVVFGALYLIRILLFRNAF